MGIARVSTLFVIFPRVWVLVSGNRWARGGSAKGGAAACGGRAPPDGDRVGGLTRMKVPPKRNSGCLAQM